MFKHIISKPNYQGLPDKSLNALMTDISLNPRSPERILMNPDKASDQAIKRSYKPSPITIKKYPPANQPVRTTYQFKCQ